MPLLKISLTNLSTVSNYLWVKECLMITIETQHLVALSEQMITSLGLSMSRFESTGEEDGVSKKDDAR